MKKTTGVIEYRMTQLQGQHRLHVLFRSISVVRNVNPCVTNQNINFRSKYVRCGRNESVFSF